MNTNRTTVYYAQKLADKFGMGGGLDINGSVASRGGVISMNPVFAQLAIARAKAAHPNWKVEMITTTADSAWLDIPKQAAVEKAMRELELLTA